MGQSWRPLWAVLAFAVAAAWRCASFKTNFVVFPAGRGQSSEVRLSRGAAGICPEASLAVGPLQAAAPRGWSQLTICLSVIALAVRGCRRQSNSFGILPTTVGGCDFAGASSSSAVKPVPIAFRGSAVADQTARGSKLVAKLKNIGPDAIERRNVKWMYYTKQAWSPKSTNRNRNNYALARKAAILILSSRIRNKFMLRRNIRKLWIRRLNAMARLHGLSYSYFICRLKLQNVNLNRKILSAIGIYDRAVFTSIVEAVYPSWREKKADRETPPAHLTDQTIEQRDEMMIPWIEKEHPDLYTNPAVRFNRKVVEDVVTYTVDIGKPEEWKEILPRSPELANYNLPDHWITNANDWQAKEDIRPSTRILVSQGPPEMELLRFKKLREQMAKEDEKDPNKPKKKGISREDWFKDEPQSWF